MNLGPRPPPQKMPLVYQPTKLSSRFLNKLSDETLSEFPEVADYEGGA